MHLNEILETIKHHSNPTEALSKLGKVLEEHEHSLMDGEHGLLKSELGVGMYEAIHGPHFNEEYARIAVRDMENEDGSKGPHWNVEETTNVANQMGINLKSDKHNKWDWYVAMNMVWSDFYKAVVAMTGNVNTKHFAELAKAWLCDKDVEAGKMWNYYVYIMCDDENDYKVIENSKSKHYDNRYHSESRHSDHREYPSREFRSRYGNDHTYGKSFERGRIYERDFMNRPTEEHNRNTSVRRF